MQSDFEKVSSGSFDASKGEFQISGVETHELFLRYPNISFIAAAVEKNPLYISRIEYARRLLYHLNNMVPECDNILGYIFYIESLYSQMSGAFSVEEITKSEKRIEDLLKKYQKNFYLYIMYTEHVTLKSKLSLLFSILTCLRWKDR